MNAIKQKSLEVKNRFDTFFYNADCDSNDFKPESKYFGSRNELICIAITYNRHLNSRN